MRSGRPKRRRRSRRPAKRQNLSGWQVLCIWGITLVPLGVTAISLWRGIVRGRHVHIPMVLLLGGPFFAVIAIIMTYEWWRSRSEGG